MSKENNNEQIASLISPAIPTCALNSRLADINTLLLENSWADMDYIFVLDGEKKLLGEIDMARLSQCNKEATAEGLMCPVPVFLKPHDKRQKAVVLAVKKDVGIIPVVDNDNKFLGAITSKTLIDLMHTEHLENVLLTAGVSIKKHNVVEFATVGLLDVVRYRLPWLILGLAAGLGLGLISSRFEEQLQNNIAVAYFIPVVAYIADSVGTQSEAIAVRALATVKVNTLSYLFREFLIGIIIGGVVGVTGGLGAFVISSQMHIGIVVGMALFVASTIAAVLASAIPVTFKAFDKDPALGSGPLATALQDIISVMVYFLFVVWFL